jgi:septum formation protein
MQKIILASQSPRRKQLLEWAEVPFEVCIQNTDETYPRNLQIEEIPVYIARQKAIAVKSERNADIINTPILAADTVVVLQNQVIGKPSTEEHAIEILLSLSAQTHKVITGVVILHEKGEIAFADITEVTFHELTLQQVAFYVNKYKPFDKAGAYAIQEWIGVVGIKSIKGDFYNVMGLPVSKVVQAIQSL